MHVLTGIDFDDLDGGKDNSKGYMSLSHGEKPTVVCYEGLQAEMDALIAKVKTQIDAGIQPGEICIVARTNNQLADYEQALNAAAIRTFKIKRSKSDDRNMAGVRIATMHRVKGL